MLGRTLLMSTKLRLKGQRKLAEDEAISPHVISALATELPDAIHRTVSSEPSLVASAATISTTFELAAVAAAVEPSVVKIIDTTKWSKPSPDPSGVTFVPGGAGGGTLLMCDSEINESPFSRPDNLFHLSASGIFDHSSSLQSFTLEPTGLAYASASGHLFVSDDDKHAIFEVDAASALINFFSTKNYAPDCEDIAYDPATNHLFIVNGTTGNRNPRTIFETTIGGTIIQSMVLPSAISDPEAIVFDSANQVFYVSGGFSADLFVVSRDGRTILDTITVLEGYRNPLTDTRAHPKGLTLAPSSNPNDAPSVMSLWVADYGKDQVMDGRIFEIQLGPASSSPPLFTANSDVVNFNQVMAGKYQEGSQYNALGGNDTVTLPVDAAAAAAAGYSVGQLFSGGDGHDVVTGGTLNDSVSGGSGKDVLQGGDGDDALNGDGDADLLNGGAGNDSLNGGGSSDTLIGGPGNDVLNGGSSNDTLDYTAAAGSVTVNLALGTATGEGNDTLLNVENVTGSGLSDTITGNTVANVLTGGGGSDTIFGGDGNDKLTGGTETDQLFGQNGHDTLKWDSADLFGGGTGFDTLDAILSSSDTIDLRGANFAELERIQTGSGTDVVTLSLSDVLSDTADNQFVADLGSGSSDTLNIDRAGGWSATSPDRVLGPTGVAAGISVSGMIAHTFTNGVNTVTVFTNADVTNDQILSS